jgi:hypothetical protein
MRSTTAVQPGPGHYNPSGDFSAAPFHSVSNITFGKGERPFYKLAREARHPGPASYDIRGKHRDGGFTFDQKGVNVNHRHGWYYDADVKASRNKPGPGTYEPSHPRERSHRKISFGHGERPAVSSVAVRDVPAPGQYDSRSTLGGGGFSFSTSRLIHQNCSTVGPICAQPTQFGR